MLDSELAIGGAQATLSDYRDHLRMLHAWLTPLEHWLAGFSDGPQAPDAPPMIMRRLLIEADLEHPAMAPGLCTETGRGRWPSNGSAAYRWGVCYVIEGSQLGGAVLYQRLRATLAPHPLRYLRGDPQGPGPRWRSFVVALRAAVVSQDDIADACAGACDAFDRILALRIPHTSHAAWPMPHAGIVTTQAG